MIARVLDLQQTTVHQITLPFARLPAVTAQMTGAEFLQASREINRNHLPVWEDSTRRRISGIIDLRTVLYASAEEKTQPIRSRLAPPLYISDHVGVEETLRRLQRSGQPLAIVLDASRREIGIVAFEEILRSIFGEVKI